MALVGIRRSWRLLTKKKSQPEPNAELPEEVQEVILARLTLPDIVNTLPCLSKSWQTRMFADSSTSSFRKVLDQKHPKMLAIVKMERRFRLKVAAFDFASGQWHYRVLQHLLDDTDEHRRFIKGYVNQACFAHQGGLLCFVFSSIRKACPIVVCNLLTNEWKAIPFRDSTQQKEPALVQLEVDDTTGHYKVTVVYRYCTRVSRVQVRLLTAAEVYDSATKLWSTKNDGVVNGWELYNSEQYARYHKCGSGGELPNRQMLLHTSGLVDRERCAATFLTARDGKERFFTLRQERAEDTYYRISECVTDSSVAGGLRTIDCYKSSLPVSISSVRFVEVKLMDTDRFLMLVVNLHQFNETRIRVRDQVTGEWHEIPALPKEFRRMSESSGKYFLCDLRWNAIP